MSNRASPGGLPSRGWSLPPEAAISPSPPPGDAGTTPRILSSALFGGGRRIIIEHGGREYSLLITRQGKLVLNRC